MDLVFFDIECASVTKTLAKICAFGYVLCDEDFNIKVKEDILIDPKGAFRLTDRKGEKGLILPYDLDEFKGKPTFFEVYPKIKKILEDKNNAVLGHATMNDVRYLNLETKRYNLPSFDFEFSDSQIIFMSLKNDFSHQYGLEHIANELGVNFTPHRAADDAYATMRIVEAMCSAQNCNYFRLAEDLKIKNGAIRNYNIFKPVSHAMISHNKIVKQEAYDKNRKRTEFCKYVFDKKCIKNGKFDGLTFNFSKKIEENLTLSKRLIDVIYANGGVYSHHITHCNYYICDEDDASQRTHFASTVQGLLKITPQELEEAINV